MDTRSEPAPAPFVARGDGRPEDALTDNAPVLTGLGHVISEPCDPTPFLKVRKMRKFMGVQDDLAVVAAGRALDSAGLAGKLLGERVGLYAAVGYIPFEQRDIDPLLEASLDRGRFSMARFSTEGVFAVPPLITFRCLSNMPAFHVSYNFDVQGPYLVTYPGPGQFYVALEEARMALAEGKIDIALVAGIAHQRNFLVSRHFSRVRPPIPPERLADAAGCLVFESPDHARTRRARRRGRLLECRVSYRPHDPFEEEPAPNERFDGVEKERSEMGAASLPATLSVRGRGPLRHDLATRDGFLASSAWELA